MARRGVNAGRNRGLTETDEQKEARRLHREAFLNAHVEPRERLAYTLPTGERRDVYEMAAELGLSVNAGKVG